MTTPNPAPALQVVFRQLEPSPVLDAQIRADVAQLAESCERITHCHVSVARTDRRPPHGHGFEICVEIGIPRGPVVVRHRSPAGTDAYAAVRDAFRTARQRLDGHVRRLRGEVKRHATGAA
jgi:hypothetical protein